MVGADAGRSAVVSGFWYPLALGLVFAVALGTRSIGLGGAVTEDEDQWIARSGTFARGLVSQEWRRTYLTGHPGVTTMWLTTLTLGIERARPFERATGAPDVTTVPDFLAALERARMPFAVLQAGLVLLAAVLVGRLLGPWTGLAAGLLFAAEPFWAGVGPVVGMDGLLTGFLTVSLLALLLATGQGDSCTPSPAHRSGRLGKGTAPIWAFAILSGVAFALAFLTKTTALFVGPVISVVLLVALRSSWRHALRIGVVWALAATLAIWVLWPAAWFAPFDTVARAITFSARLGGTPHGPGNFLLGHPVDDPGVLFYPVALLLRLGPGTTIGLLLLFLFGAPASARRAVWVLLGYALFFALLLTFAAKKVDRYLLPILPALAVLAAVGWMEGARRVTAALDVGGRDLSRPYPATVGARFIAPASTQSLPAAAATQSLPAPAAPQSLPALSVVPLLVLALALALQLWPLALAGPYPLAGYNPLVGGARVAERAIPLGWGDGLDVAGDEIRAMAGGRTVTTSIWAPLRVSFGAHAPGPVVSERQIAQADFYVDYIHARQRQTTPRQLVNRPPDAVVTVGGVEYARIYKLR